MEKGLTAANYHLSTQRLGGFQRHRRKGQPYRSPRRAEYERFCFHPQPIPHHRRHGMSVSLTENVADQVQGNVTLSLATAAAGVIGNATILEMTVVPGNNTLPLTAIIDQDKVISSTDKNGFVDMIITGTSSVFNGQHIPYYVRCPSPPPFWAKCIPCARRKLT